MVALMVLLQTVPPRRTQAEERFDAKVMYYQESDARIEVLAPTVMYQTELSPTLTIKVDGIYNAISGASPTGAPPIPKTRTETRTISVPATSSGSQDDGDSEDGGGDDDSRDSFAGTTSHIAYSGFSGATARVSTSSPSSSRTETIEVPTGGIEIPVAEIEDTRIGASIGLTKRLNRHALTGLFSYSTENDYESFGAAFTHAIDFNLKNTTLLWGLALTHDIVDNFYEAKEESKDSIDAIIGLTQVLDAKTLLTVNLSLGYMTGYLNDPYKVTELNGVLVPEQRPEDKSKQVVFASLARNIETLNGSLEASYRFYNDTFGIAVNTVGLAWHQRMGPRWILRPSVRFHDQGAADFYAVRFRGNPTAYSSDYRLSALTSMSYGMKLIWFPTSELSLDLAYERYDQEGKDAETADEVYPSANVVMAGATLWF